MEREGTSKKCRPGLAHGLFEALDRYGQRQQEDQMAKKSKKGKKAKKAKKAVVAKKKSAKKASKKAAKKSAKKAAKKGAKKSAKKAAKKSGGCAEEGRKEEPGEEKEGGCQARRSQGGARGGGARARNPRRRRAGLPPSRPHPHGGPARPTAATTTRRSPVGTTFRKGRSVHRCGLFRAGCPGFARAVPRRPEPCFHGQVDSQKCVLRRVARRCFFRFQLLAGAHQTPKNCCGNATHAQNIYRNGPNA